MTAPVLHVAGEPATDPTAASETTAAPESRPLRQDPWPEAAPGDTAAVADAPPDADTDRQLLRRIAASDRDAFRKLYLRYHPRLSRFVFRFMRRHEDTEEVVNDTMLIIWQNAATFRGASQVSTWILGISYRCALKSIRRSAVRMRTATLDAEGRAYSTDDVSQATEDRQLLELGLAQLSDEQRLVLVLAYEMGCSCDEIAVIAGCPVNTVKTRMFYARRKMRAFVASAGDASSTRDTAGVAAEDCDETRAVCGSN